MLYKTISRAYRTDSISFRDVLLKLSKTEKDKRIVFNSIVFHRFCKKALCYYTKNGYNDEGMTFMILRGSIIKSIAIDYVIYPKDNEYGVDAEIERIIYNDEIIYTKPNKKDAEAVLIF